MVKVKDLKGHSSTYTWSFKIDATAPTTIISAPPTYPDAAIIHLTASDNVGGSGIAHTYFILDTGAQVESSVIYGPELPGGFFAIGDHHITYWSVDALGNTEAQKTLYFTVVDQHSLPTLARDASCLAAGCHEPANIQLVHGLNNCSSTCHGLGVQLTSDCVACHGAAPQPVHPTIVSSASVESTQNCLGSSCHGANGGTVVTVHASCAVCHDPSGSASIPTATVNAVVTAGLSGTPASCESCHTDPYSTIHSAGNTPHTVADTNDCVTSACHNVDASLIHTTQLTGGPTPPGCAACHDNPDVDITTTTLANCTAVGCHPTGIAVHYADEDNNLPAAHVTTNTCASGNSGACHSSDVSLIHTTVKTGGTIAAPGCKACHATGVTPSTDCQAAGCHDGSTTVGGVLLVTNPHTDVAAHAVPGAPYAACFNSGCHYSDVSTIHTSWADAPGCAACHNSERSATTDCLTCHSNPHSGESDAHAATLAAGCISSGCHTSGVLSDEHANFGITCRGCHASTDARVVAAISSGVNDCYSCHSGTGSDTNLNSRNHGSEFTNPGNASGHNVEGNTIGGLSLFDGSQGVTLKTTAGTVVGNTWATPTVNVFKPGATDDNGHQLGWNSVISCNDCHDAADGIQATGPHGATQSWAVDPAYSYPFTLAVNSHLTESGIAARMDSTTVNSSQVSTDPATGNVTLALANAGLADASNANSQYAVICAKCHKLFDYDNAYTPGNYTPGTHGFTFLNATGIGNEANTAHSSHHFDLNNGAADCVNCHSAIPHGWTRPRLLINGVGTPTTDPNAAGTATYTVTVPTTTTITWTSDLYPYWQGRGVSVGGKTTGMGPLSSTDQHTLTAGGGAQWTESDCIACGTQHSGIPTDTAKLK